MNNPLGKMNRKSRKLIKRALALVLSFVIATGLALTYSADSVLMASSIDPAEVEAEKEIQQEEATERTEEITIDKQEDQAGDTSKDKAPEKTEEPAPAKEEPASPPEQTSSPEPAASDNKTDAGDAQKDQAADTSSQGVSDASDQSASEGSAVAAESADTVSSEDSGQGDASEQIDTADDDKNDAAKEESEDTEDVSDDSDENADENADEETDEDAEDEVKFPAQTLTARASDGATVTVKAPEGALPEGSSVSIRVVSPAAAQSAIENSLGDDTEIVSIAVYDITIHDADGKEIQPDETVRVSIRGADVEAADSAAVYHVEGSSASKVSEVSDPGSVSFSAEHFSEYAVVTTSQASQNTANEVTLEIGDTYTIKTSSGSSLYNYSSSDNKVAKVAKSGSNLIVTGVAEGTATITCKYKKSGGWFSSTNETVEYTVIVVKAGLNPSITISPANATLTEIGATASFTARLKDIDDENTVVWTSSDPEVAAVENGVVTALDEGTAVITASVSPEEDELYGNTYEATANVTVRFTGYDLYHYALIPGANADDHSGNDDSRWFGLGVTKVYGVKSPSALGKGAAITNYKTGETIKALYPDLTYAGNTYKYAAEGTPEAEMAGYYTARPFRAKAETGANAGYNGYNTTTNAWTFHLDYIAVLNEKSYVSASFAVKNPDSSDFEALTDDAQRFKAGTSESNINLPPSSRVPSAKKYNGINYTFDGWYKDAACSVKADFAGTLDTNVTYYGRYISTEARYRIEYYYDDVMDSSLTVTGSPQAIGSVISEYKDKAKAGFTLSSVTPSELVISEDESQNVMRVYYTKRLVSYKVGYYLNGTDQQIAPGVTKSVKYGETGTGDLKTIDGYTPVSGDKTQSALIEVQGQEIKFYYYRNVTLTANSAEYEYNGKEQSVSGYTQDIPAEFTGITAGARGTEAGTYAAAFSDGAEGTVDETGRYIVSEAKEGTLTIGRKTITVTANNTGKAYGAADPELSAAVSGYPEDGAIEYTLTREPGEEAGTYRINVTGEEHQGSYDVKFIPGEFTIDPAGGVVVTITGNSASYEYDGNEHKVSGYTVSINNEGYTENDFRFTGSAAEITAAEAGEYPLGLTEDMFENLNKNFTVRFEVRDGSLTITPKTVVVSALPGHKTYGDEDPELEASVMGADKKDITFTLSREEGEDAGEYGITASGDESQGSYQVRYEDNTFTIERRPVSVTAISASKKFGEDDPEFNADITGLAQGDKEDNIEYSLEREAGEDAGEYSITASGEAVQGNYDVSFNNAVFTIVRSDSMTLDVTGYDGFYDGESHTVAVSTIDGAAVEYSTDNGASWGGEAPALRDAGEISVLVRASHSNYEAVTRQASIRVSPREVTVRGLDSGKVYGDADPELFADVTGLIAGDSIEYSLARANGEAAGEYDITPSGEKEQGSYIITYEKGTFTISSKTVTVTAVNAVKTYGEDDPEITAVVSGVVGDDEIKYDITRAPGEDAGRYAITPSGEEHQGSYIVSYVPGELEIRPLGSVAVFIRGNNASADYDGAEHTVTGYSIDAGRFSYSEADMEFDGTASASQRNAGTSYMGLEPDQFTNINHNYENVVFHVTDGYQEIRPIDAHVRITGHSDTVPYDGKPHKVDGYEVEIESKLYSAADIKFTGKAETAEITDAGRAEMGLRPDQFENTNDNFGSVTFEITDGYQAVTPIDVYVSITGHTDTSVYDGTEHTASGYDVAVNNELYKESDFTFSGTAEAKRTDQGTTYMGLAPEQFTNNNTNFSTVTFNVTDGYQMITAADKVVVTVRGHTDISGYDGREHSVSGYDVEISNELYKESDFDFMGSAEAKRTDAGRSEMGLTPGQFSNNNDNFEEVEFVVIDGWLKVEPANVTVSITGYHSSTDYDGEIHRVSGYDVDTGSRLYTAADFTFSGSSSAETQDAGKVYMGLSPEQFHNTNANFGVVEFNVTDGYQEVRPVDAEVSISGHTSSAPYDGTVHKITGYEFTSGSSLYTESDFEFLGKASASRQDAGITQMDLSSDQFVNKNSNFRSVTFKITDGYQKVEPISAVVNITGHHDVASYDGKEHAASGYDASYSTTLYDASCFTFNGEALAARTDEGTTEMGLTSDMFENTSPNFSDVSFIVTDGCQTITAAENVVVTITGHRDNAVYDGSEHVVTGYDVSVSDPLYRETDFRFTGSSRIAKTDAGTYSMGLTADDFVNVNRNFSGVVFDIHDGELVIEQAAAEVRIKGHRVKAVYDGEEHSASGYDVEIEGDLYSAGSIRFSGAAMAVRTDAGIEPMGLTADQFTNADPNFSSVTFKVQDGRAWVTPAKAVVTITGHSDYRDYDGADHTVRGYGVSISNPLYSESDFTFSGNASATRGDAGMTAMGLASSQFTNRSSNFDDVTFNVTDGYQEIRPITAEVTITGAAGTASYDGESHIVTGYTAEYSTPLYSDRDYEFDGSAEASRITVGRAEMGLSQDNFTNISPNFRRVTFNIIDGYQEIVPADEVVVTITGHSDSVTYDGKAHKIEGYDTDISNPLYKMSDFTFSGSAEAEAKDAGTAVMGLSPDQFTNNNDNFSKVTFVVSDGTLTVTPAAARVRIIGRSNRKPYNGREQSVHGYNAEVTGDRLYSLSSLEFSGQAEVSRTDAGITYMGLTEDMFTNTDPNFQSVELEIVDGYMAVDRIDTRITIKGNVVTTAYDGMSHEASGYTAAPDTDLVDPGDIVLDGRAAAVRTDAGTTYMGLDPSMFSLNNNNFRNVTFDVTDGQVTVQPADVKVTITGHTGTYTYDGTEHTSYGFDAAPDNDLYTDRDFIFKGSSVAAMTAAGTAEMGLKAEDFENTNGNFGKVTFEIASDGSVTVEKASATVLITGHEHVAKYDGSEHAAEGYDVSSDDPNISLADIVFEGSAEARGTDEGTYSMGLEPSMFSCSNENYEDVTFEVADGILRITPADEVVVRITGHTDTVMYDGSEHSVSGYDTEISDPLYKESYISFSGKASAARTDAGESLMGLDESQFANTSSNFSKVTFEVTDGGINVASMPVSVRITGHTGSADFDGEEHSVEGYDVETGSELYTEDMITFAGSERASGRDAGTYAMGLSEASFANNDPNFGPVTFSVTDGYQIIRKINAAVTITGHTLEAEYDSEPHAASGYDAETSTELYTTSDFEFRGEASAVRTDAGKSMMGLEGSDFININPNFASVVFNVSDGYVQLTPAKATVRIRGRERSAVYDGSAHTSEGYDAEIESSIYTEDDFAFSGKAFASRMDAGTAWMGLRPEQFSNKNRNFDEVVFEVVDGYMGIEPASAVVTITGNTETLTYDGEKHIVSGYEAEVSDPLYSVNDFSFTGAALCSRTEEGIRYMKLDPSQFVNTNKNFSDVVFRVTDGYIRIVPVDEVVVTIKGHSSSDRYDGEEHSVTGYDVSISSDLYTESDFEFSGAAVAARTDAGITMMGLAPGQFHNSNRNFADVRFIVTDGYQTVDPVSVTVDITGHIGRDTYDGTSHITSGYDVVTDDPLYAESDFVFSGSAEAERTDAGTTGMMLSADQFVNMNHNFDKVIFNVTDGCQIVDPASAEVTIIGHTGTAVYDGMPHAVNGYDVSISGPLYRENDFTFSGQAEAEAVRAGTVSMGLSALQFSNNNPNFSDVVFNVTDGYQEITPASAVVYITGHRQVNPYDGALHRVSGYDVKTDTALYSESDIVFTGSGQAERKDEGLESMGLAADQFRNVSPDFDNVRFIVEDGYQMVTAADGVVVTIEGHHKTAAYDGKEHSAKGYDVLISSPLYSEEDFEFTGSDEVSATDAGVASMGLKAGQFRNINKNFGEVLFVVNDGYVEVTSADAIVTITGHSLETVYDGTSHSVSGYDAEINDPLYSEDDFVFTGAGSISRTDAGTSYMGLSAEQFENRNSNYGRVTFLVEDGSLTVDPLDVTIRITGMNNTADYDGEIHTVSGYEAIADTPLYSEADFTFQGRSQASRGTAGRTLMGLGPEQFANKNKNFGNVTFEVTDGYQEILPIEAVVTITGRSNIAAYDGEEHSVSGYDVAIDNPLYHEDYFSFTPSENSSLIAGIIGAVRKRQGSSRMGLDAAQFINNNENFSKVTFNVIDGVQTITPVDEVVVTVIGNNGSAVYDGKEHAAEGYTVEISNPLYTTDDFVFDGNDTVTATDAGTYSMGLDDSQFSNINEDFSNVIFDVTDASLTILPRDVTVVITGHANRKTYNGRAHSVRGYETEIQDSLYRSSSIRFTGSDEVSRTDAGTTMMGLEAGDYVNEDPDFSVTFDVRDGYMAVDPASAVVRITGHNSTADYDGSEHVVTGYDVDTGTDLLAAEDILFSGTAAAAGTDAGTVYMGLAPEMFRSGNDNFGSVTFIVEDGYQTIKPVMADVVITGHRSADRYDGMPHTVSGYDVSIAGGLYGESDFTFTGSAAASRTDEGTTEMGLEPDQFINNNDNFSEVRFSVTDGYQTITAIDEVVVMITGHRDAAEYDGSVHSADGYDFASSDPLYTESDFTFSGNAEVSGRDAGVYTMGLAEDQFANNNSNFASVTFDVIDGGVNITPRRIELTADSAEAEYTGDPLEKDGYSITSGEFADGEGLASVTVEGSQTVPGASVNVITGYEFADGTNADNYIISTADGTLSIVSRAEKYQISLEAAGGEFTYDGSEHEVSGLASDEFRIGTNTYTVSGITAHGKGVNAGEYDVEPVGAARVTDSSGRDVTSEFDVSVRKGRLIIGRRQVILRSSDVTAEYTGDPGQNDEVTVLGDGFAAGEGASYDVTGTRTVVGTSPNEFTYTLNEGTLQDNYDIRTEAGKIEIVSRDAKYGIELAAKSGEYLYDGEDKTVSGLESEYFTVGGRQYHVEGMTAERTERHAGTYEIVPSGTPVVTDTEGNDVTGEFRVTTRNGLLTIGRRNVVLTSASDTREYDGSPLAAGEVRESGDGFARGEGASFEISGSQTTVGSSENVFTYTLNEDTLASDYDISTAYGMLTVTSRADDAKYQVRVVAAGGSVMYDGTEHTLSGMIDPATGEPTDGGLTVTAGGHSYVLRGLSASASAVHAGTYPVNVVGSPVVLDESGNDVTSEFVITTEPGSLEITRRQLILTSGSKTHAYNGRALTSDEVEISGDGFADGEGAAYDVAGAVTLVGIVPNTFTYTLDEGTLATDYDITQVYGSLIVTDRDAKYSIVMTPRSGEYFYDGSERRVTGFLADEIEIDGEVYKVSGLKAEASGTDAGTYDVAVSGAAVVTDSEGNDVTSQFAVTCEPAHLVIRPRSIVITSPDITGEYSGRPLSGGEAVITGDGLADGDNINIIYTAARILVGAASNSFTWEFATGTNPDNYDISAVYGTISVTNRDAAYEINMTPNSDTVEYDGEEHTVTDFETRDFDIDGNPYTVEEVDAEAKGTDAGIYAAEINGNAVVRDADGNDVTDQFAVSYGSGSLTITEKEIVIHYEDEDGNTVSDPIVRPVRPGEDMEPVPSPQVDGIETLPDDGGSSEGNDGIINDSFRKLIPSVDVIRTGDGGMPDVGGDITVTYTEGERNRLAAGELTQSDDDSGLMITELGEEPVPLSRAVPGYWALLNLILMALNIAAAVIALITASGRRSDSEDQGNSGQNGADEDSRKDDRRKRRLFSVISLVSAVAAVVVFFLTEDLTNTMAFVDRYTVWMLLIFIAGAVSMLAAARDSDEDEDTDPAYQN